MLKNTIKCKFFVLYEFNYCVKPQFIKFIKTTGYIKYFDIDKYLAILNKI